MLTEMTVSQLKTLAEENEISLDTVKEHSGKTRPTKADWIACLQENEVGPPWQPSDRATSPARLTREGLLAGVPDTQIRRAITEKFPEYRAVKIAVSVYRRELKGKGMIDADNQVTAEGREMLARETAEIPEEPTAEETPEKAQEAA